jgi:hypothetical protein
MADEKEMTLLLRIKARGDEAIRIFKQMDSHLQKFQSGLGKIGRTAGSVFSGIGTVGGFLLKPLKWAAEAAGLVTAGLIGLGGAALRAAASDEQLIERLSMVYGSGQKAKKVFEELEAISRRGPFKTEDLAEATLLLQQFGISGTRSLGAVANAARISGTDVETMAMMVGGLQQKGLKRMGIEIDTKDNKYIISWKNQMGQVQKIVAKGADEARKKLLDVLAMKGGTGFGPRTLNDFVSMLKNNIDSAFSTVGGPLLDLATRFVGSISEKLTKLIESGKLEEWGKKAAAWLQDTWDKGRAVFEEAKEIFQNLDAGKMLEAIKIVMTAGAEILGTGFVTYLAAMKTVFSGLGKIIASAFMEQILQLPFMAGARKYMARKAMENMTPEEAKRIGMRPEFAGKPQFASPEERKRWEKAREKYLWDLTPRAASKISAQGSQDLFLKGLSELRTELPRLGKEFAGNANEIATRAKQKLETLGGYTGPTVSERVEGYRQAREEKEMQLVEVRRPHRIGQDNTGKIVEEGEEYRQGLVEKDSGIKIGQSVGGGVVNAITNVFIRNTDVERVRNELKKNSWQLAGSVAG